MSTKRLRPEILEFDPYVPGLSVDEIRERYGLTRIIKLASNENPLGTSPLARKAAAQAAGLGFRYPQNHTPRLVRAIAEKTGAPADRVVVGHGSDEMIDLLLRTTAVPGKDKILCYEHSFSMYRLTAKLCGVEYREVPRDEGFALPLSKLVAAAGPETALVVVTSPDNPTGLAATVEELDALAEALPEGVLLLVDEAYGDFARPLAAHNALPLALSRENVVVLRTFSKAYGLAGFRLGYAVMPAWLAEAVSRARIPFTVGVVDEAAGLAALDDPYFLEATLAAVHQGLDLFQERLPRLGCEVLESQANFVMFKPPRAAKVVFEELLKRGIIVRHLGSFGLPEHIRVNAGTAEENELFLQALEEVLRG